MPRGSSHRFGQRAEKAALLLLWVKGYRLLNSNWRSAGGELDLVMRRGDAIVFVEVKARDGGLFGGAVAAVGMDKRRHIIRTAIAYLSRHELWDRPCRFDVVTIERRRGLLPWRIRHYKDAFQPDLGRQA